MSGEPSTEPSSPQPVRGKWPLVVAMALLGIIVLVFVMVLAGSVLGGRGEEPARVAAKDKTAAPLVVQEVEDVQGTALVAIKIGYGTRSDDPYSSSGGADPYNVVLLDRYTGTNRRLLPDNLRRISRITFLPARAEGEAAPAGNADNAIVSAAAKTAPPPPPSAYYLVEVRQPEGQRRDVLVGDIASGRQALLLNNVDGIDRMWMIAPTRLALLLREGMQLRYRVIDVPALKIVASQPIEID